MDGPLWMPAQALNHFLARTTPLPLLSPSSSVDSCSPPCLPTLFLSVGRNALSRWVSRRAQSEVCLAKTHAPAWLSMWLVHTKAMHMPFHV